jgi:hypothetical protein
MLCTMACTTEKLHGQQGPPAEAQRLHNKVPEPFPADREAKQGMRSTTCGESQYLKLGCSNNVHRRKIVGIPVRTPCLRILSMVTSLTRLQTKKGQHPAYLVDNEEPHEVGVRPVVRLARNDVPLLRGADDDLCVFHLCAAEVHVACARCSPRFSEGSVSQRVSNVAN